MRSMRRSVTLCTMKSVTASSPDMEVEVVLVEAHEVEDVVEDEVEDHSQVMEVHKLLPVDRFPAKSAESFRARNVRMCRDSNAILCRGSSAEMFPDKFLDRSATTFPGRSA